MNKNTRLLDQLLAEGSYLKVDYRLINELGSLKEAAIFNWILSLSRPYTFRDLLNEDGYFFITREEAMRELKISKRTWINTIKNLEEKGFIYTKMRGTPPKKYFLINSERLVDLLTSYPSKNYPIL